MTHFLFDGFDTAPVTILLAHGAGASMDSPSMAATAKALAAAGFQVARFEFHYMAARRYGHRKPPPRAETVNPEYIKAIADLRAKGVTGKLIIGGKSMGGRVASMVADEMFEKGDSAGLVCLGYPFHPPAKPEQLRTKHLLGLKTPTLMFQGTRDELGTKDEVATYGLSDAIEMIWLEDGDHDLKPRKAISGFSTADHLGTMAERVKAWAEGL
ncbi:MULTISPECIES: alpha/beta family hydrolase [Mesorhizobium]|uniref:Alpha/beta fold hydrolase n=1 Tax=Mesorhizobium abyssinicae TaxID=1209958 RepID=A0ABU5ATP0_9HYPH|nr:MULTISPECIES: alpha/beta family hydrolase [Mesorhizobium]MDX8540667.1 alpha/beta fold hydrolase [Mesorhizobium abyssinicae]RVD17625.1 alpha/beta fold hydrolase [Mesorhizobium sp. M4B.F.Ca.ET.017.02.2.1]TGV27354.1 alpha/beta fold hydrolase [Mesorhizobium sp. M4B.F.Ca.ET.143.01.1.1]